MKAERRRFEHLKGGPQAVGARLTARAVYLLDGLSKSRIYPFMLQAENSDLTTGQVTQMNSDDLKNESDGVLVVTRGRVFSATAKSETTTIPAPNAEISLRLYDNDHMQLITKRPAILPVLFGWETNTWVFDRPHVISRRGSFAAFLTEEGTGSSDQDVSLMLLGDSVVGPLTASEVQESIALGLYPGVAGSSGGWVRSLMFSALSRGERLPSEAPEEELARLDLQAKVLKLRYRLAQCRVRCAVLTSEATSVAANGVTPLPSDRLRNDSGWPMLVTQFHTNTGLFAQSSTNNANPSTTDLSSDIAVLLGGQRRRLVWRPVVAPLVASADSGAWRLDRPMVLPPGDSLEVKVYEEVGGASSAAKVAVHGQYLEGLGADELQAAVSLGLLDGWKAWGN